MKVIMTSALVFFAFFIVNAQTVKITRGYIKKDGTYVQPHFKTAPNKTKLDNFSSKGNINPFTGKKGRKKNELDF